MRGTVTDTFKAKGFVFIRPDGEDKDLFAHARDFKDRMQFDFCAPGQRADFTPYLHSSGKRAGDVTIVPE